MSVGLKKLLRIGWQVARQTVWKEAAPQLHPPKLRGLDLRNNHSLTWTRQFRNELVPRKVSRPIEIHSAWESLSLRLRNDAVQRLFSPMKNGLRFQRSTKSYVSYLAYGFVGLALADHGINGNVSSLHDATKLKDLCNSLNCKEQKDRLRRRESVDDHQYADSLTGYQFDKLIGRGSYGATYAAKTLKCQSTDRNQSGFVSDVERASEEDDAFMTDLSDRKVESDAWDFISQEKMDVDDSDSLSSVSTDWSLMGSSSESVAASHQTSQPPVSAKEGSDVEEGLKASSGKGRVTANKEQQEARKLADSGHFNLAIKFIFNDKVRSDASAIESEFESERIVLGEKVKLREHPNIVTAHSCFVADNVLSNFREAESLFPRALPRDQFSGGRGRNMLLVLVMHRYEMTLREYLRRHPRRTEQEAQLMVCQLLEGVAFLNSCNIVHRDLKDDNILVEVDPWGTPRLAITDFGCSLELGDDDGLRVTCPWYKVSTAGNTALKAPEIKSVLHRKWPLMVQLDYGKSDTWTVGTVTFQICGMENPFYQTDVDSLTYDERSLPPLPESLSPDFKLVIGGLLRKDPSERFTAEEAANMLHLLLWKPDCWDQGTVSLWKMSYLENRLHLWLNQVATPEKTADNGPSKVEAELLATFCHRVTREGLLKAANTLTVERWLRWFRDKVEVMCEMPIRDE